MRKVDRPGVTRERIRLPEFADIPADPVQAVEVYKKNYKALLTCAERLVAYVNSSVDILDLFVYDRVEEAINEMRKSFEIKMADLDTILYAVKDRQDSWCLAQQQLLDQHVRDREMIARNITDYLYELGAKFQPRIVDNSPIPAGREPDSPQQEQAPPAPDEEPVDDDEDFM